VVKRGAPTNRPQTDLCVEHTPAACRFCGQEIDLAELEPSHNEVRQPGVTISGKPYDYAAWCKYACPGCGGLFIVRILNVKAR
jgi:predicted RNA-binding Zn-ribbon protein involved in translation (DUF1610 family)